MGEREREREREGKREGGGVHHKGRDWMEVKKVKQIMCFFTLWERWRMIKDKIRRKVQERNILYSHFIIKYHVNNNDKLPFKN